MIRSLLIVALLFAARAAAGADTEFYKGKTITIVVGSTPGGGYDAYARNVARFLGAHVPGAPNVLVQNMPGGGSLTSVMYLDMSAPRDGTVMTIFNPGVMTESIINPSQSRVNFSKLAWIGSVTPDFRICYTWHGSGLATWDDLGKSRQATFGATGQASLSYNDTQMLRMLFGRNVRAILGYPGRTEVHLAIERGELDGECGSLAGLPADWLGDHKIDVPVRLVAAPVPGLAQSVPYIGDFATSDEQRRILTTLTAANELGRPFVVSHQVPSDQIAILRQAFDQTMKDPGFLTACETQNLTVAPAAGAAAERAVAALYDLPPTLAAKAKDAIR